MLTTVCFSYLSLAHFDASLQPDAIKGHIMQGQYAFSDYTLAHWLNHLESTINELHTSSQIDTSSDLDTLAEETHQFLRRHFSKPTESRVSATFMKRFKSFEPFRSYNLADDLAQAAYTWSSRISQQSKDRDDDLDGIDFMGLETSISSLRTALDSLGQSEVNTAKFNDLQRFHGTKLFKCAATGCRFFHEGFRSLAEKRSHQDRHKNVYVCNFDGCPKSLFGFPKLHSLRNHILEAHKTIDIDNSSCLEFPITQDPKSIDIQDAVTQRDFPRVRRWAEQFDDYIPVDSIGLKVDQLFKPTYYRQRRESAISIALKNRDIKIITFLLSKVRDIENFQIALLYTCSRDSPSPELFDLLLALPMNIRNPEGLHRLMKFGVLSRDEQLSLRVLQYFGSNPRNLQLIPDTSEGLLNIMAMHGFLRCFTFLLEDIGLDANFVGKSQRTALMVAAERGNIAIVQLLLSGKHCKEEIIEFSVDGVSAAMLAAANGHESTIQLFFPDQSRLGDFRRLLDIVALRRATIEGEADTVRRILAFRDFPFDLADFNGYTPFLHAVEKGHAAVVEIFLSLGERFDINRRYSYSYRGLRKTKEKSSWPTALIVATLYGHEKIVKLLLERDDLNIKASTRVSYTFPQWTTPYMTALQIAESKELTQITQLLRAKTNPT
jgi:ankyrin repeat protein